jgi:rare lipoprotein A
MPANQWESIMPAETQAPVPYQGHGGQRPSGLPIAHRIGSLGSNILRMATLCVASVVAACTPTTPSVQTPATAASITRAEQEAVRLDQLPAIPAPHTADHSGRKVVGKASFYARYFDGKKMANGRRFNPATDVAASKTLPLGTTARVINLENGKSATVTVEDRGPYVRGRMLDVSPKVAEALRMKKSGIAHVVVKPIAVPQPDGGVKLGAGAADMAPSQLATLTTSRGSAG